MKKITTTINKNASEQNLISKTETHKPPIRVKNIIYNINPIL